MFSTRGMPMRSFSRFSISAMRSFAAFVPDRAPESDRRRYFAVTRPENFVRGDIDEVRVLRP